MNAAYHIVSPLELHSIIAKFSPVACDSFFIHHFDELVGGYTHFFSNGISKPGPPFFKVFNILFLFGEVHAGEREALADLVMKHNSIWVNE